MGNLSRLELVNTAASVTLRSERLPYKKATRLVPFQLIGSIVICADLVLIVSISVLTEFVYHLAFLDRTGPLEAFFGIGILTAVNFAAISAARGGYRPENLLNFARQVREITVIWLFVFLMVLAVGFSLKISVAFSRASTLSFFVVGWGAIAVWRLFVARLISHALAVGSFAEQKSILLAEEGELVELEHCRGAQALRL